MIAAPMPWAARAEFSTWMFGARPQTIDVAVNSPRPM
jgi:hypothetical protein